MVSVMLGLSITEKTMLVNKALAPMNLGVPETPVVKGGIIDQLENELVSYDNLPNRPPLSEKEFLYILVNKGILIKYGKNRFRMGDPLSGGYLRVAIDSNGCVILFMKDKFAELVDYVGLHYRGLFDE